MRTLGLCHGRGALNEQHVGECTILGEGCSALGDSYLKQCFILEVG